MKTRFAFAAVLALAAGAANAYPDHKVQVQDQNYQAGNNAPAAHADDNNGANYYRTINAYRDHH